MPLKFLWCSSNSLTLQTIKYKFHYWIIKWFRRLVSLASKRISLTVWTRNWTYYWCLCYTICHHSDISATAGTLCYILLSWFCRWITYHFNLWNIAEFCKLSNHGTYNQWNLAERFNLRDRVVNFASLIWWRCKKVSSYISILRLMLHAQQVSFPLSRLASVGLILCWQTRTPHLVEGWYGLCSTSMTSLELIPRDATDTKLSSVSTKITLGDGLPNIYLFSFFFFEFECWSITFICILVGARQLCLRKENTTNGKNNFYLLFGVISWFFSVVRVGNCVSGVSVRL